MQKNMIINNLVVRYKKNGEAVLDGLSFSVSAGQRVAVLARSGQGKTTLLKALCSLIDFEGEIKGVGKAVYLSQNDALVPQLSAKENLLLVNPHCDADGLLEKFSLEKVKNRQACALSGGMARRVAFARAFAVESDVVLLDEPFTALDIPTKEELVKRVDELVQGKTVVLVTHDISLALEFCSRVIVLKGAKIVLDEERPTIERIRAVL